MCCSQVHTTCSHCADNLLNTILLSITMVQVASEKSNITHKRVLYNSNNNEVKPSRKTFCMKKFVEFCKRTDLHGYKYIVMEDFSNGERYTTWHSLATLDGWPSTYQHRFVPLCSLAVSWGSLAASTGRQNPKNLKSDNHGVSYWPTWVVYWLS